MSLGKTYKRWITDYGRENAERLFNEAHEKGHFTERDFSLRDMAQGILGDSWAEKLKRHCNDPFRGLEAADAIDASAFKDISGNQLITTVKDKYKSPDFIGDQLVEVIPVTNGNLETEKEPYLSDVLPEANNDFVVQAGMPFHKSEFSYNYWLKQRPQKRTRGVDVTFEMIYADRTRQARESAASVGKQLGLSREHRILGCFLGTTAGNNYTAAFKGGTETSYATYQETLVTGRWVNHLDSTPLVSYADVNSVLQLFSQMRDPVTGLPISVEPDTFFVMPAKVMTAYQVLHATQVRVNPGGVSNSIATISDNPIQAFAPTNLNVLTSAHAYYLAANNVAFVQQDNSTAMTFTASQANDIWIVGAPKKALYYREVYPLRVMQAPPMNPAEFDRDIVLSIKATEYGVAGVKDPRFLVRCTGHNAMTVTT